MRALIDFYSKRNKKLSDGILNYGVCKLKEVRREVELSRRRSIKLKAQVDKLQESREGQGWSQHKDRVQFTTTQYHGIHPQSSGGLKKIFFSVDFYSRSQRKFCLF